MAITGSGSLAISLSVFVISAAFLQKGELPPCFFCFFFLFPFSPLRVSTRVLRVCVCVCVARGGRMRVLRDRSLSPGAGAGGEEATSGRRSWGCFELRDARKASPGRRSITFSAAPWTLGDVVAGFNVFIRGGVCVGGCFLELQDGG